jgi:hypothetical protein
MKPICITTTVPIEVLLAAGYKPIDLNNVFINDPNPELCRRRIDGVIHYVQAFCYRGISAIIFRNVIDLPMLTLEGTADYILTAHLRTKVEAFLDMLKCRQQLLSKVGGMKGKLYGFCS